MDERLLPESLSEKTDIKKRGCRIKFIPEMYSYLYRNPLNLLLLILSFAPGLNSTVIFILMGNIIDGLRKPNSFEIVKKNCLTMLLATFVNALLTFLTRAWWEQLGSRIGNTIRSELFMSLMCQDIEFFDKHSVGEFLNLLNEDTLFVIDAITDNKPEQLRNIAQILSATITIVSTSWKLIPFPIINIVAVWYIESVFRKGAQQLLPLIFDASSKSTTTINEAIIDPRVVYSFNSQKEQLKRMDFYLKGSCDLRAKSVITEESGHLLSDLFSRILLSVYFGVGSWLACNHEVTAGQIAAASRSLYLFGISTRNMLTRMSSEFKGLDSFDRIKSFTDMPITFQTKRLDSFKGHIVFNNVWFKYPTRDTWVYKGISFEVNPGDIVAFVGHTGSGKSTIVQLLLRYYDVNDGSITFDGVDIRELDSRWIHCVIGVVQQTPVLFNMSIRDNIAYARPNSEMSEVYKCAKIASADNFINKLDNKYDYIVGERGNKISGGQRQRVAIARAVLADPVVLITDEATSALSTKEEKKVQQALDEIMVNRTSIIIAHRLGTIKAAKYIYVLNQGVIVEQGTHEELIKNNLGFYYHLVKLQMEE